jgi:hypothetical protein
MADKNKAAYPRVLGKVVTTTIQTYCATLLICYIDSVILFNTGALSGLQKLSCFDVNDQALLGVSSIYIRSGTFYTISVPLLMEM